MGIALSNDRGGIVKFLLWVIVIAGVLYAGNYFFEQTPRYALIQFKRAILFSNAKIGERYLDLDRFAADLPESIAKGMDKEDLKRRLLSEIDAPYSKGIFNSVKKWDTLVVSIDVNGDKASVEQDDGTVIELWQTESGQWMITNIRFGREEDLK
ncbi:MAG TPA: hypothetical protein VHO84_13220 [Syntrophorhabdaceae bacterium]|nr:hypothetical protein [Syntrophorhabdaceae bacterium]